MKQTCILFFCLMLLTACSTVTVSKCDFFTSSANTDLNCWKGIQPGLTTMDEALILLEASYGRINVMNSQHQITWESPLTELASGGTAVNRNGMVYNIWVVFDKERLNTADLIDRLGEPSN